HPMALILADEGGGALVEQIPQSKPQRPAKFQQRRDGRRDQVALDFADEAAPEPAHLGDILERQPEFLASRPQTLPEGRLRCNRFRPRLVPRHQWPPPFSRTTPNSGIEE